MQANMTNSNVTPRRILLTGARAFCALELARQLKGAGHLVYAAETSSPHVIKFSSSIENFFCITSPRSDPTLYIDDLIHIIVENKIDLLIPMWEEVLYLSQHRKRLESHCELFFDQFSLLDQLHNKWKFNQLIHSSNLPHPTSLLLTKQSDLIDIPIEGPFYLKKCYSRGSQSVYFIDRSSNIPNIKLDENDPWIAQKKISGRELCSFSVCHRGAVLAHAVYPVEYTLDGHSCVAFESCEHSGILSWVKHFIGEIGYTGQIAFDFIESGDNVLYPIECNPRGTSGLHLFHRSGELSSAYLGRSNGLITPPEGSSQQIASGMLFYGWRQALREGYFCKYLKKFLTTKDVVFSAKDPLPFFAEPFVVGSYLLKSKRQGLTLPRFFTYDLEWTSLSGSVETTTPLVK